MPFKHLVMLNYYLLLLYTGRITRLLVTMPPQHGKSNLIAQFFICWWLGWRPDDQVAIVSYAAGVAEKFGQWCRDHFEKWGPRLFGLTVNPKARARKEWHVLGRKGVLRAVGVGGQLTSHRVDLGVIDDPIKGRKQASKSEHRESQKVWFRDEFLSRLSKSARWIIVQTRWHEDDLLGWAETCFDDKIAVVHLPAVALQPEEVPEEERSKYFPDPLGRQPGEALCPELHPIEQLEEQRRLDDDGPNFWSVYQGIPRPGKGGIFDPKYWREFGSSQFFFRWDPGREAYYYYSADRRYDEVFLSVDCSYKDTSRSDPVAIGVYARKSAELLKIGALVKRMNLDDTCAAMLDLCKVFPMLGSKLVEEKANGPEVIKRLRAVIPGLIARNPQGRSKVERAEAVRHLYVSGLPLLPPTDLRGWIYLKTGWVRPFKAEMAAFPFGTHDDQVDETTQALEYFQERLGSSLSSVKTVARKNSITSQLKKLG